MTIRKMTHVTHVNFLLLWLRAFLASRSVNALAGTEYHRKDSSIYLGNSLLRHTEEIPWAKRPFARCDFARERVKDKKVRACGDIVGVILSHMTRGLRRHEVSIFPRSRAIVRNICPRCKLARSAPTIAFFAIVHSTRDTNQRLRSREIIFRSVRPCLRYSVREKRAN